MGLPAAAQNALAKLKQGPVQVVFDPGGGDEVEIFVRDGVDLTFMRGLEAAEVDLVGRYDLYTAGDAAEFELRVPESSQEVLNVLFLGTTTGSNASGYSYHGFGETAGTSQRGRALQVRIRPWQTRSSNTNEVTLWKCAPSGDSSASQKKNEPHTWVTPFAAFPDLSKPDGCLIGRIFTAAR